MTFPRIACYQGGPEAVPLIAEERQQTLDISSKLKEMLQRPYLQWPPVT